MQKLEQTIDSREVAEYESDLQVNLRKRRKAFKGRVWHYQER